MKYFDGFLIGCKFVGIIAILLSVVVVSSVQAANETSFDQIANTTLNDLTFANQTADLKWPNGTVAYTVDFPPIVVKAVPMGLDLQIQMQIVQTFFIVIIGLIMIIRAVYDLMSWISARRKV